MLYASFHFKWVDYHKIPKIGPGVYIFQRPFLRVLFVEGLTFRGTYMRWEICIRKWIGLAYSWKANKKIMCYCNVFAFVLAVFLLCFFQV